MSEKLGGLCRAKREEMNLTLKEVENATSIRALYLQAIEEGRVGQFLSPIYAQGFIRQYAQFLGFDLEKLTKDFPEAFRHLPEKQEFSYGIGTLEKRGNPHGGIRWVPNLMWGSLLIAIGAAAWYFGKWIGAF